MDFLLECIGFPPTQSVEDLVGLVARAGEPAPWRGDPDRHRRLVLGDGLELRMDRDGRREGWTLVPCFRAPHRLRFAVDEVRRLPDSPYDALLVGWADPPLDPQLARLSPGAYRLSAFVWDARRLPRSLPFGHVLALGLAGYALDVEFVGPDEEAREALIAPLGSPADPGGCAEVSLSIREIRHLRNPVTGIGVEMLVADAPGRPLPLFLSRWQLEQDGLELPRVGWRVEGTFLFSGRIAGGLPGPAGRMGASFG